MPAITIIRQAHVKILLASFSRFCPSFTEIGTEEPTPIKSARAKLMMTKGMARFNAAKAVVPRKRPTNTPSTI